MLPAMSRHPFVAPASLGLCMGLSLLPACKTTPDGTDGGGDKVENPDGSKPAMTLRSSSEIGKDVIAQMDLTVDPCADFYQFACGGWIANNPLPEDKPRWGRGFGELGERNNEVLRGILEQDEGRPGAYYRACMNESEIDKVGTAPLEPYLAKIAKLDPSNRKALFRLIGELDASVGLGAFFEFGLYIDFEKPELHISSLEQGGTGLPDPSYYLDEGKRTEILPAYQDHVARMLGFVGYTPDDAKAAAARIVAFETELAKLQKPPEDMRDPEAVYHRWDRKGIEKNSKLPWAAYFTGVGVPKLQLINVSNPEFITGLTAALDATTPQTVQDYLRFNLISSTANLLSAEVVEANFQFAAALTGQQQLAPRWERCVGSVNAALGDLLSQKYVEQTFAGDSKDIAVDMITRVEAAFATSLPTLAWMDDATRTAAVGKMQKIENQIGFPVKWQTYDKLEVAGSFFADSIAARTWEHNYQMKKIGQKVDEQEWYWPASIVNASYNPLQNMMMFPAGILQPPFFHREFPKAMNFGAMGMVMGHELTHGFDDSGRKFDGDGVMREWWAPEVAAKFDGQAQCVIQTYSALEVQPGVNLKGELTLGENIADFGGLKQAFLAYKAWEAEAGTEPQLIDGLSNDQLFFVATAQSWCSVSSAQYDELLAAVDPHSPPKFRVNVPASHLPEFWTAFSCGEGTPMHSEQVCSVW
jgi:putative endopeptidase